MTSTRITPKNDASGRSINPSSIDVDRALDRGRHLRAAALSSVLKSLFHSRRDDRNDRKGGFSPDCAAPA